MIEKSKYLVSIVGPTAVGKTKIGIEIAKCFDAEIISVDSRQFYKEMEIGTAKPDHIERGAVKHHFVDSHSIHQVYSVGDFEREANQLIEVLHQTSNIVIAVGGSGLFFKALWEGFDEMPKIDVTTRDQLNQEYQKNGLVSLLDELKQKDPVYYDQVDRHNWQRVIRALEVIRTTGKPFSSFRINQRPSKRSFKNIVIGLNEDRAVLFDRINKRMDKMIAQGLFEEAEILYPFRHLNALNTVGYSEIFEHFDGRYDREEAIRLLKRNSRRYAKRQLTWFNKYSNIQWYEPHKVEEIIASIKKGID